ncbi:hypothetical protein BKA69DRAFT_1079703 [Paraphysoderma sedebokerense]|nr:hypothetical protein BKA69DRAFT_1097070 [Paraphysoderma sedebokerense]KAI9140571.1 hypothetical protein BKA69DRAFT_1079662 [Paraphysoderma sedebokerense]KAI9140578.1 hypothetical protein BKA69DRAFT_1079703 [Paraphysoderma sedebokerense]
MKALVVDKWLKDPQELANCVHEIPVPELKQNEVLVEVKAVGANFFDILLIQGKYQYRPKFPFIPGTEFSGVVVSCHPAVKRFKAGDRVFGAVQTGAYATHVAANASSLMKIPTNLTFEQAAGIFITYPTSYAALTVRANLKPGEIVLVHAGAGGVGLAAIQIAKAMGAAVIATASSDKKLQVCKDNGADYVINYRTQDWVKEVLMITKKKGVDVVYDPVGLIEKSMKVAAWDARLLVIGFASLPPGTGEKISSNRILLKNISIIGLFWGAYRQNDPKTIVQVWTDLMKLFSEDRLKPVVYDRDFFGLESVPDALKALGGRESYGKVVVTLRSDGEEGDLGPSKSKL